MENLIFNGGSGLEPVLKLEMMSYSDNAYDVTNFCCFEKFLAYTLFLPSCQTPNGIVKPGGAFCLLHYRGIKDPLQNRVKMAIVKKVGISSTNMVLSTYGCGYKLFTFFALFYFLYCNCHRKISFL